MFFVMCVRITLLAYFSYIWAFQDLERRCARFWKGCRDFGLGMTAEMSEKRNGHIG